MIKRKICFLMIALTLFCGCAATSGGGATNNASANAVAAIALLPFRIVGALVGAAVGVASGMGMMEGSY